MKNQKNFLKSQEIANLFGITIDALRYYEKIGLLHPVRDPENNYRYFTSDDVEVLLITTELLQLNFSLKEIKKMLSRRTTSNIISVLLKEESYFKEKIEEYTASLQKIRARISSLNRTLSDTPLEQFQIQQFPERNCIKLSDTDIPDDQLSIAISKFRQKDSQDISVLGSSDCYTLNVEHFMKTGELLVKNVFFYAPYFTKNTNFILPAGKYLTYAFHRSIPDDYSKIIDFMHHIEKEKLTRISDVYSFFAINGWESSLPEEHIIELQTQIL